jgi:septin family protein
MRAPERPDVLTSALDDLAALVDAPDLGALAALRDRLQAARLRVLVVGEAKRGKGTLVNALLGRDVRDQAEKQIGRARADLQYRLGEATRTLILAVGRRYAASTDRLVSALQTAAALREHTDGQAQQRLAELARRERALRGVLARLDQGI